MKKLLATMLIISGFWGIATVVEKNHDCINIYVDFGSLDQNKKIIGCIDANEKESALTLLENAGIKVDGTDKYGLQVVCRVNNMPDVSRESCAVMPPEDAYWAVIVKGKGLPMDPAKEWGWAKTGISEVYLEPGESLGLVFTENGEMKWPN